jgi:fumarate hydratase, class I
MTTLESSLLQLITETATNMPDDVRRAIARGAEMEDPATKSGQALAIICRNTHRVGNSGY